MTELYRAIRHGVAPLVAYLIAAGYLPEYMRGDVTELMVIGLSFVLPYGVSWLRDRLRA
jgi:hypothetical protein